MNEMKNPLNIFYLACVDKYGIDITVAQYNLELEALKAIDPVSIVIKGTAKWTDANKQTYLDYLKNNPPTM